MSGLARLVLQGKDCLLRSILKKVRGLFSTSGKELPRQKPAERFHHCLSRRSEHIGHAEQPNGDDHPFPVQQATEQVSHPLHPAIFVPE